MEILYVLLGIIVVLLIFFLTFFNILRIKKNDVNEAFATMDVYLKKRWDLIPNLVEVSKSYAKYEKDTLKEITLNRNYNSLSSEEKIDVNNKLTSYLAIVENYPELKADKNFLELQKSLTKMENEIADSRKYYNAVVKSFNNIVETFPTNLVAGILGYHPLKMFEASHKEKANVEVSINE